MTEIGIVKIIIVQKHIYNSDPIFSLVCYFPPHHQYNKIRARTFKKVLSVEKVLVLEFAKISKEV